MITIKEKAGFKDVKALKRYFCLELKIVKHV